MTSSFTRTVVRFAPSPNGTDIAYGLEYNGPNSSVLRIYDPVRNTTLA